MKLVLALLPIVFYCVACNQQAVKSIQSNSKGDLNNSVYSSYSAIDEEATEGMHSRNSSIQNNASEIVNSESEKTVEHFSVISVQSRTWISGVYGGGSGTEYEIKAIILADEQLLFDSLWVDNSILELYISQESVISNKKPIIRKGNEITLRASALHNKNNPKSGIQSPFDFSGIALLYYKVNNERKYHIIKTIDKQTTIHNK